MKQLLFYILLFGCTTAIGQNHEEQTAEYEKELANAKSDTARVRILCNLSLKARSYDLTKADEYSQQALEISQRTNSLVHIAKAICSISANSIYRGEYNESILYSQRALSVLNVDTLNLNKNTDEENIQIGHIYNNLGMAYDYKSDYSHAIKYYLAAKDIFERLDKQDGLGVCYNNLGISYLYTGDLDKSENYFQKTFDIYMTKGDSNIAYQAKMNLAIIYYLQEDKERAIDIYRETANVMEKMGNLRSYGNCISNMAQAFSELEQNDSALFYYEKAIEIDLVLEDKEGLGTEYRLIGAVYEKLGQFQKAKKYYTDALTIALEIQRKTDIKDSYRHLFQIEQEVGNYKMALEHHILYAAYDDSIRTESSSQSLGKVEAENEYNKQLAVNQAENDEQLKTEAQKRRNQSIILYFTIAILVTILFFVYMVVKSLRIAREQKALVQEAKAEIELKNQEMVDSITYAKRIQTAILPSAKNVEEHLPNSFVLYEPKDIVAGDFYWLEPKGDRVIFAAADCTGHGVPGAMVSVVCNNGLNRAVREFGLSDPGKILDKTRELVVEEFEKSEEAVKDGMDIALCSLGPSSTSGTSLQYAGAHNPLWLIRKGATEIEEIKANKQPIGQFDHPQPYNTHSVDLKEGDSVYIFSDGFADQFGGDKGKKFKAANFKKLLLQIQQDSLKTQKDKIYEAFEKWRGGLEQLDDVCIIGIRV